MSRKNKFKQWFLDYFDWNKDGIVNWWEYLIPIGIVLGIEVIAEIIDVEFNEINDDWELMNNKTGGLNAS